MPAKRPPPRQLQLEFRPARVPGAPDWERLDPARRARAVALLARLMRRVSGLQEEAAGDD